MGLDEQVADVLDGHTADVWRRSRQFRRLHIVMSSGGGGTDLIPRRDQDGDALGGAGLGMLGERGEAGGVELIWILVKVGTLVDLVEEIIAQFLEAGGGVC